MSLIGSKAGVARVEQNVRATLRAGIARGGPIAEAALARLGPAVATIDNALKALRLAQDLEASARAAVAAEKEKSDAAIGVVRDAMWNTVGRQRQSAFLEEVFPEGIGTYTGGDPRNQPVLMKVLMSRIGAGSAPQWTQEMRDGWVATLSALRDSLDKAVEAHRPTKAIVDVSRVAYRATVRSAHARLRDFKRDLQTMGLDGAQIRDIIPDGAQHPVKPAPGSPPPAPHPTAPKPPSSTA